MIKLIRIAIDRPITTFMFYLGLLLLGFLSLRDLAVELFPPIDFPELIVHTAYDGALPGDVEQNITRPLEDAVAATAGLQSQLSQSLYGESIIRARYDWGTDMRHAALDLRQQLDRLSEYLPQKAGRSVILRDSPANLPFYTFTLSGVSEKALGRLAVYVVKRRLEQIGGVAHGDVVGMPVREIFVEYDPQKLMTLGLKEADIKQALSRNNVSFNAGSINKGHFRLSLRVQSAFKSVSDIRDMDIYTGSGLALSLKKVARVYEGNKQRESLARINGQAAIALELFKESGANTLQIAGKVEKIIERLRKDYPRIHFTTVNNQARFIRRAINSMVRSLLIGALLAFLSLYIFLGDPRAPLVIGLAIPVSIIIAFILMKFCGISLNIISLAGLSLGSGMLVVNSLIVLENIQRHREGGLSLRDAAIEGAREVGLPITASTLTTVAVFVPVIFLKGLSGALFGQQAATASFSLLASLLVALTLLPVLLLKISRKKGPVSSQKQNYFLRASLAAYSRGIDWCLRRPNTVLWGSLLFTVLSMTGLYFLPNSLLPDVGQRAVNVQAVFPPGASMTFMDKTIMRLEKVIEVRYSPELLYARVGKKQGFFSTGDEKKINRARIYFVPAPRIAPARILNEMHGWGADGRVHYRFYQQQTALQQLLGHAFLSNTLDISGPDFVMLDSLASRSRQILQNRFGSVVARTNYDEKFPVYILTIDRKKALRYGLNARQIADKIRFLLGGITATDFRDFDKKIPVTLRARGYRSADIDHLLQTAIGPNQYPLKAFVAVRPDALPQSIERIDQERTYRLYLNPPDKDVDDLYKSVSALSSGITHPANYRLRPGGAWRESSRTMRTLLLAFLLSILLVYLLLAAQFESFRIPFVIMFTVPLAFIGIAPLLFLTGQTINLMTGIGIVVVVGIVVNDGIVKIDFIERMRKQGLPMNEAIHRAGLVRLRPILLTTVTTVAGMLPLALAFGQGAALQQPLAIAVIGGISVSTFLTLFVLPLIYMKMAGGKPGKDG